MIDYIPHPLIIPVGIAVGVLVAAPVGPVNIVCIQRAIERGAVAGIAAGLGAVVGDGLIALMAAMGVGAISGAVQRYRDLIQIVGGLALIAFGLKLCFTAPRLEPFSERSREWSGIFDYLWDVPKTFILTVTNPGAVLGLIAIFGGISSFVEVSSSFDALLMVASIMAGSLLWWVTLATMIGRIRHRVTQERLRMINIAAGALLIVFGGLLVGELLFNAARLAWAATSFA
ncbi:MAG: LysE family translocator [Hyphomicrobiaceae bacterium]